MNGVFLITLWTIWNWRNRLIHATGDDIGSIMNDDIFPGIQRGGGAKGEESRWGAVESGGVESGGVEVASVRSLLNLTEDMKEVDDRARGNGGRVFLKSIEADCGIKIFWETMSNRVDGKRNIVIREVMEDGWSEKDGYSQSEADQGTHSVSPISLRYLNGFRNMIYFHSDITISPLLLGSVVVVVGFHIVMWGKAKEQKVDVVWIGNLEIQATRSRKSNSQWKGGWRGHIYLWLGEYRGYMLSAVYPWCLDVAVAAAAQRGVFGFVGLVEGSN
ncbi:hypothetical protein Tco_1506898 [Tanacetum coccineum]